MKTLILVITGILCLFVSCCGKLFSDEKFSMNRLDYNGNHLRIDGYYYYHDNNGYTLVLFLYRNGTMLLTRAYLSTDLNVVEKQMVSQYENLKIEKLAGEFSL